MFLFLIRSTTNQNQFEILVEFMVANPGIAKNLLNAPQYKAKTNSLWTKVEQSLNSVGPPRKTIEGWKKVSTYIAREIILN